MSDDTQSSGAGEIDALKWYVHGMVVVSVIGAGFVWWVQKQTKELTASVKAAESSLVEMSEGKHEVLAMLKAYKKNKEDEARDQPLTWFQAAWLRKGIPPNCIQPDAWKVPADISADGKYVEEKISLKFSSKSPMRREQIAGFLHEVEQSSSRLRVLTLRVVRAGREDALANDEWTGSCEIGYRYPFVKE